MRPTRLVLVGLTVFVLGTKGSGGTDVPGRYVWPLEGSARISAGFCDYRTRHFHGGIDISTNGREGLPVRAADSGWVMRVSTSWWGYGKVVYIHLATGGVAVYGHLSDFAPKIAGYVEDEQYASLRYQQNLLPAPDQIPVARGEIIGKTGQTGVGPPHLHFELRTDGNRPVNPLTAAFQRTDKIAPSILSVTLVPRQPQEIGVDPSTVNGSLMPITLSPADLKRGGATAVSGTIGVAVLANDRIDSAAGIVSPYTLRLLANGKLICEVRYDSINYDQTRLIDLEERYDPAPGIEPRKVNLFRWGGNFSWHYDNLVNDGWLTAGKGLEGSLRDTSRIVLRIEAEDAAGNLKSTEFRVMPVVKPERTTPQETEAPTADTFDIKPAWNGLVLSLPAGPPGEGPCSAEVRGRCLGGWPRDRQHWDLWIPALPGLDTVWLRPGSKVSKGELRPVPLAWTPIAREDGGVLRSSDGAATVTIGPDDLYESTFLSLRIAAAQGKLSGMLTPLYEFAPADIPLGRDARLTIFSHSLSTAAEKLAIYRYLGKTAGWDFSGDERDTSAGTITATIPRTGSYALLADTTPPTIRKVTPGKGETIKGRQPTIRFDLADDLSGFGSDRDVRLTIDGDWVPVEYDPDLGTAKARPRSPLPKGEHKIMIVARDRMGNESTFTRALRITQ